MARSHDEPAVYAHDDHVVRVLVAEDDDGMLDLVCRILREEGYATLCARTGSEAMALLERGEFDLIVTDVRMPGADGIALLHRAMAKHLHQPVIMMTAFGSIESAVLAMRDGAYHYLAKPFDIDDLLEIVGHAATQIRQTHSVDVAGTGPARSAFPVVFRSRAMADLLRMVAEVAVSQATVLITGGSGTGKEVLARTVHAMSARAAKPFVPVDCNAIAETLIESELFGHKRGSFTGALGDKPGIIEQADGGTLFLDEVGNLSPSVQAKLLRFLQERRFRRVGDVVERAVDIRVISATNSDLRERVQRASFREDLFYRLSVIPLRIPDLKDRREDIAPLAYHFLRAFNQAGYHVEGVRRDALDTLMAYSWPGNVRQLENVIERAVILRKAGLIQPRDLPEEIAAATCDPHSDQRSLEDVERDYITRLLSEHDGNQSRVARILGINRRTLYRKLRKYGGVVDDEG